MWSNQHKFRYSTLLPQRAAVGHEDQPASVMPNPIAEVLAPTGPSQRYCLVVVPTYNEAQNIVRLIAKVLAQGPQFDVLVVDDNSPDGTGNLVAALAARTPRVRLLRRAGKLGLGSAYLAGFREGLRQDYAFLCEMDADFSHQPHDLPMLLATAEHDADVVIGSRNVPGGRTENWSWARKALSRGGNVYARTLLAMPVRDCTGGFKCFRASVLHQLDLAAIHSNGYAFQIELNYRCYQAGFRIREAPIVFPNRVAGKSKMSWRIVWEAVVMVWRLRLSQTFVFNEVA